MPVVLIVIAVIALITFCKRFSSAEASYEGPQNLQSSEEAERPYSTASINTGVTSRVADENILNKVENIKYNDNNVDFCISYIQKQIQLIKKLDPQFHAFGSDIWKYSFKNVTDDDLSEVESSFGITISKEFKNFVLKIGYGAAPVYGAPLSGKLAIEKYDSEPDSSEQDQMFESGYIVVSEHGCGIETRLCLDPNHYGEIWRCDGFCYKVSDNYIDWYINWVNGLLTIFAYGEYISFHSGQF